MRKKTIRRMPPVSRKLAKLVNEFQSSTRRLKYLLSEIQDIELGLKIGDKRPKPKFNDFEDLAVGDSI
jgi:hypothetical protein